MAAIEVDGLRMYYGALRAVDGVSFAVQAGEVFALLGPNGAGKTTTVEILEGYRARTAGVVRVLGADPQSAGPRHRARIGVVLQAAGFEEEFSVRELVVLQSRFYPRFHDPDEVIDLVGLAQKRQARVKTLSGGQRRRLDLALGLVGCPEVLFLDEPTTGFDPSARHRAWDLVARLRELGTTILLTTHYLEEAARLADRLGVLRAGRLVALGTPDEIVGDGRVGEVRFALAATSVVDLPPLSGEVRVEDHHVVVRTTQPTGDLNVLTGWALARGVDLTGLTVTRPTLEEAYLGLVEGEESDDAG